MDRAFIKFGHGYETGSRGRCDAFDGYTVLTNPLGGFDSAARESRSFPRRDGSAGVTYGSHMLQLAVSTSEVDRPRTATLYILVHHGGGREVLRVPTFYDNGDLREHILAMPERLQYALLYTIWNTARNARYEAAQETRQEWAQAYAENRIRKRRATNTRAARVEITQRVEVTV